MHIKTPLRLVRHISGPSARSIGHPRHHKSRSAAPVSCRSQHTRCEPAVMTTPKVQLPVYSWREKISGTTLVYIRDRDEADKEVDMLKPGPVGFDMEWKPTFVRGYPENPTALVQIANKDKILLIQVSAMTSAQADASNSCSV